MSVNFSGIVPTNYPVNSRFVLDANYVQTFALPGAAGTVHSTGFNLIQPTPFPVTETINFQVLIPATTTTMVPDASTLTVTIEDSADGVTYAAIPQLAAYTLTGAGGAGTAATTITEKLPPSTRQYVRVTIVGSASTTSMAALNATQQLVF